MKRNAIEIIRDLESRIARLEKEGFGNSVGDKATKSARDSLSDLEQSISIWKSAFKSHLNKNKAKYGDESASMELYINFLSGREVQPAIMKLITLLTAVKEGYDLMDQIDKK